MSKLRKIFYLRGIVILTPDFSLVYPKSAKANFFKKIVNQLA